jgi:hypothetical protein
MVGKTGDELITQKEAARRLKKSLASVNNLVRRGRLRSEEFYGKRLVFLSDVLSFKPIREGRPPKVKAAKKTASKKKGRGK